MALPSLLVFGPQTTWPTSTYLSQLRAILLLDARLDTFLAAIKALPSLWQDLVEHDPCLATVPGLNSVQDLLDWLKHGEMPTRADVPPNVLTMPLTIIIHVVQFLHYIHSEAEKSSYGQILENVKAGGVQGFCTGLLTAIAVACSKDEESVNELGAVALRLALCIGAYVDLDGAFADQPLETSSIAVRWKSEKGREMISETLKDYPNVYISVIRDSTDVNITVPKTQVNSLSQQLFALGMTLKDTGLEGRYHTAMHRENFRKLCRLCDIRNDLNFPPADNLLVPVRSNSDGRIIGEGPLHRHALQCIMMDLANWHLAILAAVSQITQRNSPFAVSFGLVDSIPSSIVRDGGLKVVKYKSSNLSHNGLGFEPSVFPGTGAVTPEVLGLEDGRYPDYAVAVVGMACKFPGADSIEEFWQLLTSGTSMLQEISTERFSKSGLRRSPEEQLRFWGNFVRDVDAFDHRFFKKSSREAASMDPQQRLLLQVAYEAMESSGYFGSLSDSTPDDIGCYLGICGSDYNDNVASHPPNAFSSLGTLRAFLSGKVSHFFGWTGPSITYDTACSSSAVAIDAACKAVQTGECSQAVAGGVSLYTSPNFYQNLAAASFLSPTGATKPFDAKADGYCRGEGAGLVVLKKLSAALKDRDTIYGVIASSAVNQNRNSTYITVPHSPSQIDLYKKVSSAAGIDPHAVSFVEAHGTGTPVGDPIEFESIRKVFGGARRSTSLNVASVKGNIGHLEGASGVAALIKTLLMIQRNVIPIQANHNSLSPKIPALEPDRMAIPLSTQNWDADFKVACINNYGAAGSNAAMIVCEPPSGASASYHPDRSSKAPSSDKYPLYISANSASSLMSYCGALRKYYSQISSTSSSERLLIDITFNLAEKQNPSLPHILSMTVSSLSELDEQLNTGAIESNTSYVQVPSKTKPLVLVFGGQVSSFVGLSKDLYETSTLLRYHLDGCDTVLRSSGLKGLYPEIFQTSAVGDIVQLHSMLFALQYSCAKSWIDCGLHVDALVGHSFGQLTAFCISGTLSLEDGLKLVSGRATLMQKHWGSERGSMIAVEADLNTVLRLLSSLKALDATHNIEVACYNGPSSHVLVGSEVSIQALERLVASQTSSAVLIKLKKLNNTYGYHSRFTEPILPGLKELADRVKFNEPTIELETCSTDQSWPFPTAKLIAEHTRTPVYFGQAIERISQRLGPCTWLEAGSASSVVSMVRRALGPSNSSSHTFQPIQLNSPGATGFLADATAALWKSGHKVRFWPFHRSQKHEYSPMDLPPYQFEKNRHWLSWIDYANTPAPIEAAPTKSAIVEPEPEPILLSFAGYQDQKHQQAEFRVDPRSEEYKLYVQGHAVLAEPLCPAPLYIELVSSAAMTLTSNSDSTKHLPYVEELEISAPLGLGADCVITIVMTQVEGVSSAWTFKVTSHARGGDQKKKSLHATGKVRHVLETPSVIADLSRYERLVGYQRCQDLRSHAKVEAMQGALIYKVFGKVVQYANYYKGVRKVYSRNREIMGEVMLPPHNESALKDTVTSPLAIDNFIQVAGLHVNSLNDIGDNEVFVCTRVDRIQPSTKYTQSDSSSRNFEVYSNFTSTGDKSVVNDIFVFDSVDQSLVLVILGAHFQRVLISSLSRVLARANVQKIDSKKTTVAAERVTVPVTTLPKSEPIVFATSTSTALKAASMPQIGGGSGSATSEIDIELRKLLNSIADVPLESIEDHSTFEELGIDSLMVTEVMGEICKNFDVTIPTSDWQDLADIKTLCEYLISKGCARDMFTPASDSDSAIDVYETSSESKFTAASSVTSVSSSQDGTISKLADLVKGHLETTTAMTRGVNLADEGLDSLMSIELANDIKVATGAVVDMSLLSEASTFGDLCDIVLSQVHVTEVNTEVATTTSVITRKSVTLSTSTPSPPTNKPASLDGAQLAFEQIRYNYDVFTEQTGFSGFWKNVYPSQARLVLAYTVEAFAALGCSIESMRFGERLSPIEHLPKHALLVAQMRNILKDASLVAQEGASFVRTSTPAGKTHSSVLLKKILQDHPQHASEHKLLDITGSRLADCLTGAADPLQLLFRSKANKELLEDVYTNGPMYEAITKLLGSFFSKAFTGATGILNILELGGGTGGTTKYIVEYLTSLRIPFTYTFTDISGSLVAAAKKKFAGRDYMDFVVLDIEKRPMDQFLGKFHTVLSTNCIHATRNLTVSMTNIHKMLRPDGFVSLVEFTRNIYWFDLVFGLLGGWWLYEDGRKHVLANKLFWETSMRNAGFKHVSYTDGTSEEARTLRIITAFPVVPVNDTVVMKKLTRKGEPRIQTVVYKQIGDLSLHADVYLPTKTTQTKRPIALMVHGGGHVMFTRKEVNPKQVDLLLENGFLPVSVEYRFCPEVNILEGPMADVCDALRWARYQLPSLPFDCPGLQIDGDRVAAIGWSTGGHLAMTIGYTARQQNLRPPEAVLAFYAPIIYEDDFWKKPIFLGPAVSSPSEDYDLLEGIRDEAIASYYPPVNLNFPGQLLSTADLRWRFVLHMNWKVQTLPFLLTKFPTKHELSTLKSDPKEWYNLPLPSAEQIASISPYAQIQRDNYRCPTFLIHGTADGHIPYEHSQRVVDALVKRGVEAECAVVEGAQHLFDSFPDPAVNFGPAVQRGYEFLFRTV